MKTSFKKVFSVVLALAMVLSAIPAMAEDYEATITVNGLVEDNDTVYYVQIIKPDRTVKTGWVFTDEAYLTAFKNAYDMTSATEQEVMARVIEDYEGTVNGAADNGAANGSSYFQAALKTILATNPANTMDGDTTKSVGVTGEDKAGVYAIKAVDGDGKTQYNNMAAYVSFGEYDPTANAVLTLKDAEVEAKKATLTVDKVLTDDTDKSISIGDTADYKITATYPYFAEEYHTNPIKFWISDSSEQLGSFTEPVVKVTVDGVETTLVKGTDYNLETSANGFVIKFVYNHDLAGGDVVVTYSATVIDLGDSVKDADTDLDEVINTATVTTNPMVDSDGTPENPPSTPDWNTESVEISDTYEHTLTKVDSQDPTNKVLTGAQFQVLNGQAGTAYWFVGSNGVYTVYASEAAAKAADPNATQTLDVDSEGNLVIKGLDANLEYWYKETKAPAGYQLNTTTQKISTPVTVVTTETQEIKVVDGKDVIVVTTTHTVVIDDANDNVEAVATNMLDPFANTKLSALPSTGGIGTYVFTMAGTAVMAAAVIFFMNRKETVEA